MKLARLFLLIVVYFLAVASAVDEAPTAKNCTGKFTVPHLWKRYHSQIHTPVPIIHATIDHGEWSDCKATQYKIEPDLKHKGVFIDQDKGLISMETNHTIPEEFVIISAVVNGKTINIGNVSLEIFDCMPGFKLQGLESSYKVQRGSEMPIINMNTIFGDDPDDHCTVDYYEIEGLSPQMTLDKRKGIITVDTTQKLNVTYYVDVIVGSQKHTPIPFTIQIFDCLDVISFPQIKDKENYLYQIGSEAAEVQMKAETSEPATCMINLYALEGETTGTTIDANTGILTVDTSAEIALNSRKISIFAGLSNEKIVSPEFNFEVFDCKSQIKFVDEIVLQLDAKNKIQPSVKEKLREGCSIIQQFAITIPIEGVTIDNQSGNLQFDTSKVLTSSRLSLEILVGSQTISYDAVILIEIIDCIVDLTFAQALSVQMGSEKQEFMGAVYQNQIERHKDFCSGGEHFLTDASGSEVDGLGIQIDKDTSQISVATSNEIQKTSLVVTKKIGTQEKISDPFDIEVFDCEKGIIHAPDIKAQMGSPEYNFAVLQQKPTNPGCNVEIEYGVEGLTEGVTFETEGEGKGFIKVDTSVVIDTIVKYTVTIGKQSFEHDLKIEVFDCFPALEFTKYYQALLGSTTATKVELKLLVKNKKEDICAVQSFVSANILEGITIDEVSGKLTFPIDKQLDEILMIDVTVGLQVISVSFPLRIYSCQSIVKFKDNLKFQKDTGLLKLDFMSLQIDESSSGTGDSADQTKIRAILEEMKNQRFDVCKFVKYTLSETVEGINLGELSGQLFVDTSKIKATSKVEMTLTTIDDLVYKTEVLTIAMFDCNNQVSLPPLRDFSQFQVDSEVNLNFAATITGLDCQIDQYELITDMKGVSIDANTGKVSLDTSTERAKNDLMIQLKVGGQTLNSKSFQFEIYDCASDPQFPNLKENFILQKKEEETQEIDASPRLKRRECIITAAYEFLFEGSLPEGVNVDSDAGKLSIDTSNSIAKQEFQVVATLGSQTIISPKFNMEVFDCEGVYTFITAQKIQVDDRTVKSKQVIPVITDNQNEEQCGDITYSVAGILGPGISIKDGMVTIETHQAITKTEVLKFIIVVGVQTFETEEMTFEVFDCIPSVTFPEVSREYKYQLESTIPDIEGQFISNSEDCLISQYRFSKDTKGMTISDAGLVKIDPKQEIKKTELQIIVTVGTQTIFTSEFIMEVFDCYNHIIFAEKYDHQVNPAEKKVFSSIESNDRPYDCKVSAYQSTGLTNQISLNEASGEVQIDTQQEIQKAILQISASVGSQTVQSPKFEFEVYDCSTAMKFADSPSQQINDQEDILTFNILASNSKPKQCGEYTMTFVENPFPAQIKKGTKRGEIDLDLSQELLKTSVSVEVSIGIQKLSHTFANMEIFDCANFIKFPELDFKYGYRYQIDIDNPNLYSVDGQFKSSSDECKIISYSLTKQQKGIEIDENTALIQFGYTKNIPGTETQIAAQVGTQLIKTEPFIMQVFDCEFFVTQPYLWKNHQQQVQQSNQGGDSGYQLQRYLYIYVKPISNDTMVCRVSNQISVEGLQPGVIFDKEKNLVRVDKDIVSEEIKFNVIVRVGTQTIDLPYVTILPREDPVDFGLFFIITIFLALSICILICVICHLCSRNGAQKKEIAGLNKQIEENEKKFQDQLSLKIQETEAEKDQQIAGQETQIANLRSQLEGQSVNSQIIRVGPQNNEGGIQYFQDNSQNMSEETDRNQEEFDSISNYDQQIPDDDITNLNLKSTKQTYSSKLRIKSNAGPVGCQ